METSRTDKDMLYKGLNKMALSLICMFVGPTLLYIAFSNQQKSLYYLILILGGVISILAIYFAFKGLMIIMDSMFKKK
ncbi:DUF6095 family protein [Flavobacteriaceae bacterium LMO-SS05]